MKDAPHGVSAVVMDTKIDEINKRINNVYDMYRLMSNSPERVKLWKAERALVIERRSIIDGASNGNR